MAAQGVTKHVTYEMLSLYTMGNDNRVYLVRSQQAAIMVRNASLQSRTMLFEVCLAGEKVRQRKHGNLFTSAERRQEKKDFKLLQGSVTTKAGRQKKQAETALKESVAAGKKKAKNEVARKNIVAGKKKATKTATKRVNKNTRRRPA